MKKNETRTIPLTPYHGQVIVCGSLNTMRLKYERMTGSTYPFDDSDNQNGGRYIKLNSDNGPLSWLVWGWDHIALTHELAHVLLQTFGTIGHDPTTGDGEPFCYMLSHLMNEAMGA